MSGFFFGPADTQLFGYHHVPPGVTEGAVVVCPPFAHEYQYAHRALHFLARRLAAKGYHVLRFDYSGTGDSWGRTTDADVDRWYGDVSEAIEEIRAMSGIQAVDLVGLRLGALVAAQAAVGGVRKVVLWDPIVDGERWLAEVGAGLGNSGQDVLEVAHALVSKRFEESIRSVTAADYTMKSGATSLLALTQRSHEEDPAFNRILATERVFLEQPAPWIEDESIWTGQIPVEVVERIVSWIE